MNIPFNFLASSLALDAEQTIFGGCSANESWHSPINDQPVVTCDRRKTTRDPRYRNFMAWGDDCWPRTNGLLYYVTKAFCPNLMKKECPMMPLKGSLEHRTSLDPMPSPEAPSHPILIIGASGMLGKSWARMRQKQPPLEGPTRRDLDLKSKQLKHLVYKLSRSSIVPLGLMSTLQRTTNQMRLLNRRYQRFLQGAAKSMMCLLHYSTDYVFSGYRTPYAVTLPLNHKACTKDKGGWRGRG